jgi:ribosomal protein S6--L-glutamate ligase
MILSFHPNIVAHENILCAGRMPDASDEKAIRRADAVILSQGCSEALYRMCVKHCTQVFPNYDCRFDFPGKLGQARLFQQTQSRFPKTHLFHSVGAFQALWPKGSPIGLPVVFKSNWGGEGETVFFVDSTSDLTECLARAATEERAGHAGFLIQEFIPTGGRDLRVVIMGRKMYSYWRFREPNTGFLTNLGAGGEIDHEFAPDLQERGKAAVADFCGRTKIDLAGFDLLFPSQERDPEPLFLEINYFFGRKGLGGSFRYYELLDQAVNEWLVERGMQI